MNFFAEKAPVTYALIAVNAVVFILDFLTSAGNSMGPVKTGGVLFFPLIKQGQFYRLITSMFIHFGFMHILCNMYGLRSLGPALERFIGKNVFLILYLISGLAGNLLTCFIESKTGSYSFSAGASGAVFGLLGAWLVISLSPRVYTNISNRSLIITLGINILYGLANRSINMAAHAGGFAAGAAITYITILMKAKSL